MIGEQQPVGVASDDYARCSTLIDAVLAINQWLDHVRDRYGFHVAGRDFELGCVVDLGLGVVVLITTHDTAARLHLAVPLEACIDIDFARMH